MYGSDVLFVVEDARLNRLPRKYANQNRATGAAVVKWYCKQIDLHFKLLGAKHQMVKFNKLVKMNDEMFASFGTGLNILQYPKTKRSHIKDAFALVVGK